MKEINGRGDKIIIDDEDLENLSPDSAVYPHKGNVTMSHWKILYRSLSHWQEMDRTPLIYKQNYEKGKILENQNGTC